MQEHKIARPKLSPTEKKSEATRVRLNLEEKVQVMAKADKAGMTLSAYLRHMALNGKIVVKEQRVPSFATRHEMGRVGNNLNQMVRYCHEKGFAPPEGSQELVDRINDLLDTAYEEMGLL